jgi:predicted metal-binding protein
MSNKMRNKIENEIKFFIDKNIRDNYKNKLILWDGHCLLCEKRGFNNCSLEESLPCRFPDEIRYSMESVGIHVTRTVKDLNLSIEWPPENFCYRFGLVCLKK